MRIPTQRIHNALTLLLAFSLPLHRSVPPILIALLFLNWLIEWNWQEKFTNYKTNRILLLPCLLYLLYCLGMLYTQNTDFGISDLGMKVSLLILPLIFASKPSLSKDEINKALSSFTIGCALAVVLCLGHSIFLYYDEIQQVKNGTLHDTYTNVNFFFSSQLSYFMHPSYFAMYLGMSMIFIFSLLFSSHDPVSKPILVAGLLIFSIAIAFLASRMGIILLVLLWLGAILYVVFIRKKYLLGITSVILLSGSFFLLYKNSQIIASRIDYTLNTLETKNLDKTSTESSTERVLIWEQAIKLIKESPMIGVGTGDIKDALLEKYKAEGMTGALEHRLNAHNQFLQAGVALGIPGLLLMLAVVLLPLFFRKYRSLLFIFFSICILLNFSVESMVEIQAGVLFFSFFNSILLLANKENPL